MPSDPKPFWVSWYSPRELGPWQLRSPWWVSGFALEADGDVPTICAAVMAEDEAGAKQRVMASYDTEPSGLEWRFCEPRPADWSPFNDRFPAAKWMQWP